VLQDLKVSPDLLLLIKY